jgi:hypothetical protein
MEFMPITLLDLASGLASAHVASPIRHHSTQSLTRRLVHSGDHASPEEKDGMVSLLIY